MEVERDVSDAGADTVIIEVQSEDTGSGNTAGSVDDDVIFEDEL